MKKQSEQKDYVDERMALYGALTSPFNWTTGDAVGTFLTHLRDHRQILGLKCSSCGIVHCPPFDHCEKCSQPMSDWVEVAPFGKIEAVAVVHHAFSGQPADPPYAYVLVKLEGADTSMSHLVLHGDFALLRVGDWVEVEWANQRKGSIRDIDCFRPVDIKKARAAWKPAKILKPEKKIDETLGKHRIPYEYSFGRLYPRFYGEMRDNKKIVTVKCSKCGRGILPPRPYCGNCFADAKEWVELPTTGKVRTFTTVYYKFLGQPKEPPYCYVVVVPDGHDCEFHHLIEEVDYDKVHVGMRVEAVWAEDRRGTIWDIKYFRPVRD